MFGKEASIDELKARRLEGDRFVTSLPRTVCILLLPIKGDLILVRWCGLVVLDGLIWCVQTRSGHWSGVMVRVGLCEIF